MKESNKRSFSVLGPRAVPTSEIESFSVETGHHCGGGGCSLDGWMLSKDTNENGAVSLEEANRMRKDIRSIAQNKILAIFE
jgi:hypothetical protein